MLVFFAVPVIVLVREEVEGGNFTVVAAAVVGKKNAPDRHYLAAGSRPDTAKEQAVISSIK